MSIPRPSVLALTILCLHAALARGLSLGRPSANVVAGELVRGDMQAISAYGQWDEALDRALSTVELPPVLPRTGSNHDATRRHLQEDYSLGWTAMLNELVPDKLGGTAGGICNDPLATNAGHPTNCTYTCDALKLAYFPESALSSNTRCFLYGSEAAGQWPTALTDRISTKLDWKRFLLPSKMAGAETFTVGPAGHCTNLTVNTTNIATGAVTSSTTSCVMDGNISLSHGAGEAAVVSFTETGQTIMPNTSSVGGSVSFILGQCKESLIRVTTTATTGDTVIWTMNDGGHNGPWTFSADGVVGQHEFYTCLFSNTFTLLKVAGTWSGTVEVRQWKEDNTITVPVSDGNPSRQLH